MAIWLSIIQFCIFRAHFYHSHQHFAVQISYPRVLCPPLQCKPRDRFPIPHHIICPQGRENEEDPPAEPSHAASSTEGKEEGNPRTRAAAGTTEPVVRRKFYKGRCSQFSPMIGSKEFHTNKTKRDTGENHSQSEPLVFRAFGLGGGVCKYEQAKRYTDKPGGTFFCFLAISFFSFSCFLFSFSSFFFCFIAASFISFCLRLKYRSKYRHR